MTPGTVFYRGTAWQRGLRLYGNRNHAEMHLRNHPLCPPEATAWAVIAPEWEELTGGDSERCFRLARDLVSETLSSAEQARLWTAYVSVITRSLDSAFRLGWTWRDENTTGATPGQAPKRHRSAFAALGPDGLLVLWREDLLVSAYIPGQGSAEAVINPGDGPLRRQRRVPSQSRGIAAWRAGPPLKPADPETVRFKIFRTAAQHVRSRLISGYLRQDPAIPEVFRACLCDRATWLARRSEVSL